MNSAPLTDDSTTHTKPANWFVSGFWVAALILLCLLFREATQNLYGNISRSNSYYSHAFLVPFVSLFFVWRQRQLLVQIPRVPTNWGYAVLALACTMVLAGDLLGFRIFAQAAIIPLLTGLVLIFLGARHVGRMWFPLVFLLFMIPLPESLTTSVTFRVKMLATEGAVRLSQAIYLPVIHDGSYIHFGEDRLMIGDVCSGMRSLIALLALGAIMSYISETRAWSRVLILLISAPIAVAANVLRIFFLCVVANFWGSSVASGWVHDVSGLFIYVVALGLMIAMEGVLRRIAPRDHNVGEVA
ncbi:MAG: exosortase [Nitrospiraceae bacterium]|nr:exosortase [Nitrospiraceae bacterium]